MGNVPFVPSFRNVANLSLIQILNGHGGDGARGGSAAYENLRGSFSARTQYASTGFLQPVLLTRAGSNPDQI